MEKKFDFLKYKKSLPEEQIQRIMDAGFYRRKRVNGTEADRLYVVNKELGISARHTLFTILKGEDNPYLPGQYTYGNFIDLISKDGEPLDRMEILNAKLVASKAFFDAAGWIECYWTKELLETPYHKYFDSPGDYDCPSVCLRYTERVDVVSDDVNIIEVYGYKNKEYVVESNKIAKRAKERLAEISDGGFDYGWIYADILKEYHRQKRFEIDGDNER